MCIFANQVAAATISAALLAGGHAVIASAQPLNIEDLLHLQAFGPVIIEPGGEWLVYEKIRPYGDMEDYSFRNHAQAYSGQQIWRVDLSTEDVPHLLPGLSEGASHYIDSVSPCGGFLVIFSYEMGAFRVGSYDMSTEETRWFRDTPNYVRTGRYQPVWISDSLIAYPAVKPEDVPLSAAFRTHATRTLWDAWHDAWRGDVTTAQVLRFDGAPAEDAMRDGLLVVADVTTGESTIVAEGGFSSLSVSPGGEWIAALLESELLLVEGDIRAPNNHHRHLLTLINARTQEVRTLAADLEFFSNSLEWSVSGDRVTGYAWPVGEDYKHGSIVSIDVTNGDRITYDHTGLELISEVERTANYGPERVVVFADSVAVFARSIPDNEEARGRLSVQRWPGDVADGHWIKLNVDGTRTTLTAGLSDVSAVPVFANADAFVVAAAGGVFEVGSDAQIRRLGPETDGTPEFVFPAAFGSPLRGFRRPYRGEAVFDARIENARQALIVETASEDPGDHLVIPSPDQDAYPLAASLRAGVAAFQVDEEYSSARMLSGRTSHNLETINDHLNNREFGTWTSFSYVAADPEIEDGYSEIESCVLLPASYDHLNPPPLIIEVYPNAQNQCARGIPTIDFPIADSPYLWAAQGFAYTRLATPSRYVGEEGAPFANIERLIEAGVEALARERLVDETRVVLVGRSQGGVLALYTASKTDIFRGVIALHSWANLASHYFSGQGIISHAFGTGIGYSYLRYETSLGSDFAMGRTPFEDPLAYVNSSPVFLAPDIKAPVLLIHTDLDVFTMSQFDEMYAALLRAGSPVTYVRYLGEGHLISSPANMRDLIDRQQEFLDETVGPTSIRH